MIIYIDRYKPSHVGVRHYEEKGLGIITYDDIRPGELIYEFPICKMPEEDITIVSSAGYTNFIPHKHLCDFAIKYNIFPYWDCLLNHGDKPNAFHDYKFESKNGRIFSKLYAMKYIKAGEEILINYMDLVDPLYVLLDGLYIPSSYFAKYIPNEFPS
jgi:hypothetical protein